ncbi:MAG: GTPase HflX [Planctomycetota bacterium]
MKDAILTVQNKKALLVDVLIHSKGKSRDNTNSLDELSLLAETAGAIVVGRASQNREKPGNAWYVGKGKAEELAGLARETGAEFVIFDNDLSPAQIRNLEEAVGVSVIDRAELILAIFGTHARTTQAKLQLELAQLEYNLPRLKHLWGHLSRLAGGVRAMRGPGEKQLEVDRRLAFNRITTLKRELKKIQARREKEVATRSEDFTVALVGYTNAGKSTLMNCLTGLDQMVENKLFSTLDTKTHIWEFASGQKVLLSDTVGFIRNLPHNLVESFHATLEEVRQADLLLHIVDVSSQDAESQINAVNTVLDEIDCGNKDIIIVLNKIDRADRIEVEILRRKFPEAVVISALKALGIEELEERLEKIISARQMVLTVKVPMENGRLLAYLHQHGIILDKTATDSYYKIRLRIGRRDLFKAKELGLTVKKTATKAPRHKELRRDRVSE